MGLHRLEYESADIEAELDAMRITNPGEREELFGQYSENYGNAWAVVIQFDGESGDLDFGQFSYGVSPGSPNNQAAWMETILTPEAGRTKAAFYLHYLQPGHTVWYEKAPLPLPQATPAPAGLFQKAPYSSPD